MSTSDTDAKIQDLISSMEKITKSFGNLNLVIKRQSQIDAIKKDQHAYAHMKDEVLKLLPKSANRYKQLAMLLPLLVEAKTKSVKLKNPVEEFSLESPSQSFQNGKVFGEKMDTAIDSFISQMSALDHKNKWLTKAITGPANARYMDMCFSCKADFTEDPKAIKKELDSDRNAYMSLKKELPEDLSKMKDTIKDVSTEPESRALIDLYNQRVNLISQVEVYDYGQFPSSWTHPLGNPRKPDKALHLLKDKDSLLIGNP